MQATLHRLFFTANSESRLRSVAGWSPDHATLERMRTRAAWALCIAASSTVACDEMEDAPPDVEMAPLEDAAWLAPDHDPLERAREELGRAESVQPEVPAICFGRDVFANQACAACHERALGAPERESPWKNAQEDPRALVDEISEFGIVSWIRQDNYDALRREMTMPSDYVGVRPDIDLRAGFDRDGLARDGSGWRAARVPSAPELSWPDGQSTSEVLYRLPVPHTAADPGAFVRTPDGEGFPVGTELFQVVRYLDPDVPSGSSVRVKELRAMRKVARTEASGARAVSGDALSGIDNGTGWRFSAFIEDERGQLRLETDEEQRSCVGCHSDRVAAATDSTFSFVPAAALERRAFPSRARALELGKAYRVLVERQRFDRGRETGLRPVDAPSVRATTALR